MISMELIQKLIAQSESTKIEFKEEVNLDDKYSMADFLHHILSLANSPGNTAYLIIGVQDETKKIIGLRNNHGLKEERIQQLVRRYCSPPISFSFNIISMDGEQIGVVAIPPSSLKPHSFSEDIAGRIILSDGKEKHWKFPREKIYLRRGSITDEAVFEEIELMKFEAIKIRDGVIDRSEDRIITKYLAVPLAFSPVPKIRGFVGREDELRHISNDFQNSPVVIIEGLAGIGKSTLATKYIRENINDLKNAFWIECHNDTSLEDILMAFADYARRNSDEEISNAVNEERPTSDRIHSLIEVLEHRKGILCLDAFEYADGPSIAILIKEILQHAQYMKVLICTRERPKSFTGIMSDLEEVPLKGLQKEDSIELLKTELRKKEKEDALDVTFEEIAKKTEGHPFAIKLFVPLVCNYNISAKELLSDSPEFGQTLEENWLSKIFIRLSDDEREMLERFSIFTEPVKRDGIRFVYPSEDWSSHLQKLQDKFLINFNQDQFYTHALIREFCMRKLRGRDEVRSTANRAAEYYLHNQNISEYDKEQSQEQIDAKLRGHHYLFIAGDHFQAAKVVKNIQSNLMRWSRYTLLEGLIDKTFESVKLDALDERQKRQWLDTSNWLKYYKGRLHFVRGELDEALKIFEQLPESADSILRIECIQMTANIYLEKGLSNEVIALFEKNLELFRHKSKKIERMLEKVGMVYIQRGDLEKADALYKQLLDWQSADADTFGGSITLKHLAIISLEKSDIPNALAYATLSHQFAKETNDANLQGLVLKVIGDIHEKSGQPKLAINAYDDAFKTFTTIENKLEIQKTGGILVRLLEDSRDSERVNSVRAILEKYRLPN